MRPLRVLALASYPEEAAGPPDPGHGRLDQRDHPRSDHRALPRQVHPAAPGGRGRRESSARPGGGPRLDRLRCRDQRRCGAPGPGAAAGRRRVRGPARHAGHQCPAGVTQHRAGQPGARLRRPVPHRRPQVRARRAQRRARRRHVLPPVPGSAGEARPGLLGVQLQLPARRQRCLGYLRRLPAGQGRRGARDLPRRDREGDRRRPVRRGARPAARASSAARSSSAWRTRRRG